LILTDLNGRQVLTKNEQKLANGINVVPINKIGELPNGTYFLRIITSHGAQSIKVVKTY